MFDTMITTHLPVIPSEKTKKEPSLLKEMPFGNWMFLTRTTVSLVAELYRKTLPLSSPEKTRWTKFLHVEWHQKSIPINPGRVKKIRRLHIQIDSWNWWLYYPSPPHYQYYQLNVILVITNTNRVTNLIKILKDHFRILMMWGTELIVLQIQGSICILTQENIHISE